MNLLKTIPFSRLSRPLRIEDDFENFINDWMRKSPLLPSGTRENTFYPEIDIADKDNHYKIVANLPGVDPENLEVVMDRDRLTIKGDIIKSQEEKDENYIFIERTYGTFNRTFNLLDIDENAEISSNYKKGILTLTIPKKQSSKVKRISIKSEE